MNGDERIACEAAPIQNDSLHIHLPYFNTSIALYLDGPELLSGHYINHDKQNYSVPVNAVYNEQHRFTNTSSSINVSEKYQVLFRNSDGSTYDAVLLIENNLGKLSATFLTETGDYRYLQGNIMNNSIYLSSFDGAHLYFFQAGIKGDSLTQGIFQSGPNNTSRWQAQANSSFDLRNPEKICTLTDSNQVFDFSLPNLNGDTMTWRDFHFDNKVVIVEIMGSWCPNCLDAHRSLTTLRKSFPNIEVLPIAFEYASDIESARAPVMKVLGSDHTADQILFAGKASKSHATQLFPMLSGITAFPTLIVITPQRKIHMVYTGFYGPGTGDYHSRFMMRMKEVIHEAQTATT